MFILFWCSIYFKKRHFDDVDIKAESVREDPHISISENEKRCAWARLPAKIYEVHAFVCPECSSYMKGVQIM